MIILDKGSLAYFLLPRDSGILKYKILVRRLRYQFEVNGRDPITRNLIVQICEQYVERSFESIRDKDDCLGIAAAAAAHVGEHGLWKKCVAEVMEGFDKDIFADLGRQFASGTTTINLDECVCMFGMLCTETNCRY